MSRMRWVPLAPSLALALCVSSCAAEVQPYTRRDASPTTTAPSITRIDRDTETVPTLHRSAGRAVTVRVRAITCSGIGSGSGFLVEGRYLISNRHVVEGAYELQITTWDGQNFDVEVAGYTRLADISVMQLTRPVRQGEWRDATRSIPFVVDRDPRPGEKVYAAGYPGGDLFELTEGEVIDYARGFEGARRAIRTTAHVEPGNSGGPLLDAEGSVVGVVYAIEVATGYGLAVPISEVLDALQDEPAQLVQGC